MGINKIVKDTLMIAWIKSYPDFRRNPLMLLLLAHLLPVVILSGHGTVATAVSLGIFVLLRDPLGAVWANVVGFSATVLGNSWANRMHGHNSADGRPMVARP